MNMFLFYILGSLICILVSIIWKYYIFEKSFQKSDLVDIVLISLLSWIMIIAYISSWVVLIVIICFANLNSKY